jgi:predicted Zn-dependent protease
VVAAGTGCVTPRAERLPPVTAPAFELATDEKRLWREAADLDERARKSGAVRADPVLERYLTGVARRLTPRAALDRIDVRVRVVESPGLSAFCAPDGTVFTTLGLLSRLENEAQLATVLGHEIVHALNRHAIVEYRTLKHGAALAASLPLPFGLGQLGTLAAVTGYSRDLEREADEEGLALLAAGGWDVREAPRPFEHLAAYVEEEQLEEPFFFATHPRLEERRESFEALLRTRYAQRKGGEVGKERYRAAVRDVTLDAAQLDLAAGRFGAAERGAKAYLEQRPRSAEAWALLGDAARQRGGDGADEKALGLYRKAVDIEPRCAVAQRGLGLALVKRGDRAGARAALRAYLKLAPSAPDRPWIEGELAALEGKTP